MSDVADVENNEENIETGGEPTVFEVGYHILPTLSDELVASEIAEIKALIEEKGGKVIGEGEPELIDLEYEMTKVLNNTRERFQTAYFGWVKFELVEGAVTIKEELDQRLNVLRYLLIKTIREDIAAPTSVPLHEVKIDENKVIETPKKEEKPSGIVSDSELTDSLDKLV